MDPAALASEIVFEASLATAGVLLFLTYVAFSRMNKDVRRARLFLMADRVRRFLGAFTFGFVLIAAASILTIAGFSTAATVFLVVIFLFLGAIVYGSLELFLIIRPRKSHFPSLRRAPSRRATVVRSPAPSSEDAPEEDAHAPR